MTPTPTRNYAVELFYPEPPQLPEESISACLIDQGAEAHWDTDQAGARWCAISWPRHAVLLPNPATPRCILTWPEAEHDPAAYESALQQSWDWPGARSAVAPCRHSLLLLDADTTGLHYRRRLELFEATLAVVLDLVPPAALFWEPAGKFIDPALYALARQPGEAGDPLLAPINVRMFNIQGKARPERVMDTLGLTALGLPDLQCHFADLDPNAVGHLLYEYAYLMMEQGDVMEEGHTVQGLQADEKWRCRREDSLVAPKRAVIDLQPGAAHAGNHRAIDIEV